MPILAILLIGHSFVPPYTHFVTLHYKTSFKAGGQPTFQVLFCLSWTGASFPSINISYSYPLVFLRIYSQNTNSEFIWGTQMQCIRHQQVDSYNISHILFVFLEVLISSLFHYSGFLILIRITVVGCDCKYKTV